MAEIDEGEVRERAKAAYAAAALAAQDRADADPTRQTRMLNGREVPVRVEIQPWERLSPPIRKRWVDRARAALEMEVLLAPVHEEVAELQAEVDPGT